MTTLPAAPDPDLQHEVSAIADYIAFKWTPIARLEDMVQDIRVCAERAARVLFEDHPAWEIAVAAQDARESMLIHQYGDAQATRRYYDAGWQLIGHIQHVLKDTRSAALAIDGVWDYGRQVNAVLATALAKFPGLVGARPKGWGKLESGYNDFDGQQEYDSRPDRALFKGSILTSTLAGDFVERTALPYVMYDEKCQGCKAHYVLVGAIFSQFMLLAEQRNTQRLCDDLRALIASLPQTHVYDLEVDPRTPILQAAVRSCKPFVTQQDFEDAQSQQAAYAALSEAEKAVKDSENEASLIEFIAELARPSTPRNYATYLAEEESRNAPIRALLKDALGEAVLPDDDGDSSKPAARRERSELPG